jgi:hypothetical protein
MQSSHVSISPNVHGATHTIDCGYRGYRGYVATDDITTLHEAVVSQICSSLRACCCLIAPYTPHIYHILRYPCSHGSHTQLYG